MNIQIWRIHIHPCTIHIMYEYSLHRIFIYADNTWDRKIRHIFACLTFNASKWGVNPIPFLSMAYSTVFFPCTSHFINGSRACTWVGYWNVIRWLQVSSSVSWTPCITQHTGQWALISLGNPWRHPPYLPVDQALFPWGSMDPQGSEVVWTILLYSQNFNEIGHTIYHTKSLGGLEKVKTTSKKLRFNSARNILQICWRSFCSTTSIRIALPFL